MPDRPGLRLKTQEDVFAHAEAEGVELRLDGAETAVAGEVRRTVAIRDGRTSTEVLRRTEVDGSGQESLVVREYAMPDRAGRLQLPAEYTVALGMADRVLLGLEEDHIQVWPDAEGRDAHGQDAGSRGSGG